MAAILKWPKISSPSDFYLMTSTFDIGEGLMIKKTWSQTFIGGGCTVTLSVPWINTKNDRKCTKNTFEWLYINFLQDRNIFYWHNWILHPKKHMHRHQFCDSNCFRTQVMAQNVISRFRWRPFWKWPKTGSPSQLFLMASTFDIGGGPRNKKNLV